jgi:hypothetical protein
LFSKNQTAFGKRPNQNIPVSMSPKNMFIGILFAALIGPSAPAEAGYRAQVQAGILGNENSILNTLQAFQSPFNGKDFFCFSFVTRVSNIDLDSLHRFLRDKDAETYLPDLELPRQVEVKAELGSESYSLMVKKLEEALSIQAKLNCNSVKDQAVLKTELISIFANLVRSHSAVEDDSALVYQKVDSAEARGLLTQEETASLKKLAAE